MINEKFFLKKPVEFQNGIYVYPPSVGEVVGDINFTTYRQTLLLSQEDIEDSFIEKKLDYTTAPTPFEFLLSLCYNNKEIEKVIKKGFKFFIKEDVIIAPTQKLIIIGNLEDTINLLKKNNKDVSQLKVINEENYFDFQNLLRESIGEKKKEKPNPNEHPKVKKMKAKARYRDKVKAKKQGIDLGTTLSAICCMGLGLNPLNIGEISYACIPALMGIYQQKEQYNIGVKSLLAGAKASDVKLKYWIRKIDEE